MRIWVCSECSGTAEGDLRRRGCGLPRGWEHHNPMACTECIAVAAPRTPVADARPVCGACITRLIDAVLDTFKAPAK